MKRVVQYKEMNENMKGVKRNNAGMEPRAMQELDAPRITADASSNMMTFIQAWKGRVQYTLL
jgi:hypothetical protein